MQRFGGRRNAPRACVSVAVVIGVIACRASIADRADAVSMMEPTEIGLAGHFSTARAINEAGVVVGQAEFAANQFHAFRWDATHGITDIDTLGGLSSYASAVSSDGTYVAGSATFAGLQIRAFRWDAAHGMTSLGTLGGSRSTATGVNSAGTIVGSSTIASGAEHAFVWDEAHGMTDLGTLGGRDSAANAINDSGIVVGETMDAFRYQAFRWDPVNGVVVLAMPGGGRATAMNNDGEVAGVAGPYSIMTVTRGLRGFLWDLNTNSQRDILMGDTSNLEPTGIDANGRVVGLVAVNGRYDGSGFVWDPTTDTASRVTAPGDGATAVVGINSAGQMVGYRQSTSPRALLWEGLDTSATPRTVSVAPASISEGNSLKNRTLSFAVTLSQPATSLVSVSYAVSVDGSSAAADASDFKARTGTIYFTVPRGKQLTATTKVVNVIVKSDTIDEGDETFRVTLSGASGGYGVGVGAATGTILDDDPASGQTVSVGDTSVWEGNRVRTEPAPNLARVAVTLTTPAAAPGSVIATLVPGTAHQGTDYVANPPHVIKFRAGQSTAIVTVKIQPDFYDEPNETLTVVLSSPSSGIGLGRSVGTITILSDE